MQETLLGGKWELAIGSSVIPPQFLGDITPNYEEGVRETTTQAGIRRQPSGVADTAELTFTLYLPNIDYLKAIWGDIYNSPVGPYDAGNFVFGSGTCQTRTPVVVNAHLVCDEDSRNDIHIYAGLVSYSFNPTLNATDSMSVEVTIYMQPTEDGYFQIGAGDVSEAVLWDATAQDWEPVDS